MPSLDDFLNYIRPNYNKYTPQQIQQQRNLAYRLMQQPKEQYRSWAQPVRDVVNTIAGMNMLNQTAESDYSQRAADAAALQEPLIDIQGNRAKSLSAVEGQGGKNITTGSIPDFETTVNAEKPDIEAPKTGFALDEYLKGLAQVESSGGKSRGPNKYGYGGPFGFRKGEAGLNDDNWDDDSAHVRAAAQRTIENAQAYKAQFGELPSNEDLYVMHNQGANGGLNLIGAKADTPAWKVLQEASGAKDSVAKERVIAQISSNSPLAKKPVDQITAGEFKSYLSDKFNGGWKAATKSTDLSGRMNLGGPKPEDTESTSPKGAQVAQATIPPAVSAPSAAVNPENLRKILESSRIPDAQKEMIMKMMIEGAQPKTRETATGTQEFRPSNPQETSSPGALSQGQISLHGITIPTVTTRLPDGKMINQFMLPNGKLSDAEGLMEWSRKQGALDTRETSMATKWAEKEQDIQQRAEGASRNRQMLSMAKMLARDPSFYSGTGANRVLDYTKMASYLTGNPNWSGTPEAFSKLMAGANIAGLEAFKGYGQIRNPEIELLQKTQGNLYNSQGAIEAIIKMNDRAGERLEEIGQKMREYRKIHGRVDSGFEDEMAHFYKDRPLFSDEEIKDYKKTLFGGNKKVERKEVPGVPGAYFTKE